MSPFFVCQKQCKFGRTTLEQNHIFPKFRAIFFLGGIWAKIMVKIGVNIICLCTSRQPFLIVLSRWENVFKKVHVLVPKKVSYFSLHEQETAYLNKKRRHKKSERCALVVLCIDWHDCWSSQVICCCGCFYPLKPKGARTSLCQAML